MQKAFWARTMHIPALAILTIATVLTAAPARAQTYNPTIRSACKPSGLHRMRLYLAASVQRVGIGPGRPVPHQSIFCKRASAR
jgi:hypothetical protein